MKKLLREKFKSINLIFFLGVLLTAIYIYFYVNSGQCNINCSLEFKKGILNPIYSSSIWLVGILGSLLIFPATIFRKWLFYIAPPILLITLYLVQGISVYSGNPFNPTRAKMAENGMLILSVVTVIFVLIQFVFASKEK